jgi:hypothetical protein
MLWNFEKKLKLKQCYIKTWVRGDVTAIVWRDKRDINILTNMHHPPAEGNFCDAYGNALKPAMVQDTQYVGKSDHMMSLQMDEKYFFTLWSF